MKRLRRWSFRIAALAGALLVAFGIGEAILRAYEEPPPEVKVQPVKAKEIPNPLGLRDSLESLPSDPRLIRIAFLGDSYTYGLGVEAEQAFPRRVGVLLDRFRPGCYLTINLGKPGNDLPGEWLFYDQVRDGLRPQVVVHVMNPNDLDVDLYRDQPSIEQLLGKPLWPSRYSHLFGLAEMRVRGFYARRRAIEYLLGGSTPGKRDRAWNIAAHEIEATRRLVEQGGGTYVLVRFPYLDYLPDNPLHEAHRRTADLARRLGLTYLDLWDAFRGRSRDGLTQSNDAHPNPAAHEIVAEAIADFLIKVVLPKVPPGPASAPGAIRSPTERTADEIRHFKTLLELDPTCFSAEFWLAVVVGRPIPPI
jgi:hypothetical protein